MSKIIGNTTATPNPRPDWAQTDETKADYIKNKPKDLVHETSIKDTISGNPIVMTEVSPIQNQVNVQLKSKNLLDFSTIKINSDRINTDNTNGIITVGATASAQIENKNLDSPKYLKDLCPKLEVGKTYILSCNDPEDIFIGFSLMVSYGSWDNPDDPLRVETISWKKNTSFYVSKEILKSTIFSIDIDDSFLMKETIISELQVEEGTIATSFVPYINNFESIKVYNETTSKQYYPDKNGLVRNIAISHPETRLRADSDAVYIDCEYFKRIGLDYCVETGNIALNNENVINNDISPRVSALETYVYDNDDQVLGLEVDFVNNKFTRLSGAKGLLPGEDFNRYRMYGQRRRCNVDDEGNILNFLGDETPTYYRLKLYEGKLPTSVKETTITTPLYYVMRQQEMTEMLMPGVGTFFVSFDGKEPTMVALKPTEKTLIADGVSAIAGGRYDGEGDNLVSYYDGTFTLTTDSSFPDSVKVTVVFWSGYDESGFHGQVMVYQPKFYYKVVPVKMNEADSSIADVVRYYVSDKQRPEFKLHPAFYDKNGNEIDYILLSAYEAGLWSIDYGPITDALDWSTGHAFNTEYDMLLSIANIQPISGEHRPLKKATCESLAQNRGENWHIENIKTLSANQLLMIIEYGQMNMQEAIGIGPTKLFGYAGRNGSLMTGSTVSLGNNTGSASESKRIDPGTSNWEILHLPGDVSISYRGFENPWGNLFKFIDGIYYDNTKADGTFYDDAKIYVCSKLNDSEYTNTGLVMTQEISGYISRFKYSKEYDWLFIPAECNGTDNLPVGDTASSGIWGKQVFTFGGTYYTDRGNSDYPEGFGTCGPFKAFITRDDLGNMYNSSLGTRLIYIPTASTEEV